MANCIKCGVVYEDTENYYCPPCLEEKNQIAKEIDARMAGRRREHIMSPEVAVRQQGGIKSIQNGVEVTTYRDPKTAQILGR